MNSMPFNQENNTEENSKTSLKNNILAAAIIALSVMIIGISGSYAFFLNEVHEAEGSEKGLTISSGELQLTFATESDKYINAQNAKLMSSATALASQNYTEFSVTLPSTAKINKAAYVFYLTGFSLTENFKNTWVKWALFDVTSNSESLSLESENVVAKGDFSNVTFKSDDSAGAEEGDPVQKPANDYYLIASDTTGTNGGSTTAPDQSKYIEISKGATGDTVKKYRLYIWLENDETHNQTSLLKGKLSAQVAFRGISKVN